ncbi:hypothetical protein CPB85DRAFT_1295131 [Mucidula mucida]|nr:hypothetical protein CPB85DRAFT_1295131 [Mucidula mucida]
MSLQKRARSSSLSSLSSASPPPTSTRKRAKLETKECPICSEHIPVRLLQKHTLLESQRVDRIIDSIGSTEVLYDDLEEGSSTQRRRSAIRAQKSISSTRDRTEIQTTKTLQSIKKNRKKRYAGLREMTKEIEEGYVPRAGPSRHNIVCPVCLGTVSGDQDVLDAHVDACLADASRKMEEERQRREMEAEEEEWEEVDETIIGNVRGSGFHTRDHNEQDVEEAIDVDGDDDAFGCAQFTEGDILPLALPGPPPQDVPVDIENDDDETLRELVAAGKTKKGKTRTQIDGLDAVKAKMDEVMGVGDTDRMDLAILTAKQSGSKRALVSALEEKVKHLEASRVSATTSLLCRICLDPYNEPTVSTGCWHTCCRECWLRCLGSTKLCPICKRITGATDLRRVYL